MFIAIRATLISSSVRSDILNISSAAVDLKNLWSLRLCPYHHLLPASYICQIKSALSTDQSTNHAEYAKKGQRRIMTGGENNERL
jgi:hypothetical protein